MARNLQRVAIVGAIVASLVGYLSYAPNSEGIAQMGRVRVIGAGLKLGHLIVCNILFILYGNISFSFEGKTS